MAHASPDPHEGLHHKLHFGPPQSALAQLSIQDTGFHDPSDRVDGLSFRGVRWQRAQGGFTTVGHHQDGRLTGSGCRPVIAEAALIHGCIAFARPMQEEPHFQRALMFRDEISDHSRQAMPFRQFQTLVDMGLQHRRTRFRIIEGVVGIGTVFLIFDEPVGSMQFADVVIEGSRSDQVHIGTDGPCPLFGQAADHQGVLKGAGRLAGQAPQQGPFLVGQFQQPSTCDQPE